jgi:putative DNA primase/helicase
LTGEKAGVWADFAGGSSGGDLLDLIEAVKDKSFLDALQWAADWLGKPRQDPVPKSTTAPSRKNRKQRSTGWLRLWNDARPIAGTTAERYLQARRLPVPDDVDEVLRFLRHCPSGTGSEREYLPAMLLLFRGIVDDEPQAIHRIALTPDGSTRLKKMMLGPVGSGAVKLSNDDTVTLGLGICEGIETGLAIIGAGWRPVWAIGSAIGIRNFPVLPGIEALTIFADADENRVGEEAAHECADRWRNARREIAISIPKAIHTDWADIGRRG